MAQRVLMKVYCPCGELLGEFKDAIEEKYPFWCPTCEEQTEGKYPWRLAATVIEEPGYWQETTSGRVFVAN